MSLPPAHATKAGRYEDWDVYTYSAAVPTTARADILRMVQEYCKRHSDFTGEHRWFALYEHEWDAVQSQLGMAPPSARGVCPDCKGSRVYVGLGFYPLEPCRSCARAA